MPICPKTGKVIRLKDKHRWAIWLFPITGFLALVWFLLRVVPKPSRAAYPCQRVAAPLASGFLVWLSGTAGSIIACRKARRLFHQSRYVVAGICVAAAVMMIWWAIGMTGPRAMADAPPFNPTDLNMPIGVAKGIYPGRVVWVFDPNATPWDGVTGYWWEDSHTDPNVVHDMMSKAVRWLTAEPNDVDSWDAIFKYFNRTHGYGDLGYQPGEKIAIKINGIQSYYNSGTRSWDNNAVNPTPQMVYSLLWQLIVQAGVDESAITVYECVEHVGAPIYDRCHASFPNVNFADHTGGGGLLQVQRDPNVRLHYGDPNVLDSGEVCFPDFVVEAKYLINMALFKGHLLAGVTLCAKNLFGSIWRPTYDRFEGWDPGNMHYSVAAFDFDLPGYHAGEGQPMGSFNALVDLMGHENLGGKTLLYLIDGLYTPPEDQGGEPARWLMSPFNNRWTSSLFASLDGVAIDSVAVDFLRSEPTKTTYVRGTLDNYLHEEAQADNPPSGTFYDPENDGTRLESLGVHEHWNNKINKQYTRNLRTGCGIELISSEPPERIVGDHEPDGDVDYDDLNFIAAHWLDTGILSYRDYFVRGFQSGVVADMNIPRTETPPTIDGKLTESEWQGAFVFEVDFPDVRTAPKQGGWWVNTLGRDPTSAEMSISWYFMWDVNNLYVAISVNDNSPYHGSSDNGPYYTADVAQLTFSLFDCGDGTWKPLGPSGTCAALYDIVPDTAGQTGAHFTQYNYNYVNPHRTDLAIPGAQIQGQWWADGWLVEISIPWSEVDFYDHNYVPSVGDTHGINLLYVNRNGSNVVVAAYALGGTPPWNSMGNWPNIKLVESNSQSASWPWHTGSTMYEPLDSPADLYKEAYPNDVINFRDFALFAVNWLKGI